MCKHKHQCNQNVHRHPIMHDSKEIRHAIQAHDNLNALTVYTINGWLSTRSEVKDEIQPYWPF